MVKLFACDLDGTLLNRFHCSDKHSHRAVLEVLKNDKVFVVATGRHLHGTHRKGLSFIDLPIYKVCMNGALVRGTDDTVLHTVPISDHVIKEIQKYFPNVSCEFITEDGVYIHQSKWQYFLNTLSINCKVKYLFKHLMVLCNDKQQKPIADMQQSVLKIDAYIPQESEANRFRAFLNTHKEWLVNAGPNDSHFEITASGANKKTGVQFLTELLQINQNDVMVYGNDINDIEMLSYFPKSYAPANAIEAVKKIAREVLEPNIKNGVAKHILKVLKNEI